MRTVACRLVVIGWLVAAGLTAVAHADAAVSASDRTSGSHVSGLAWRYAYDEAGRVTQVIGPGGQETEIRYTVDDKGRVQEMTTKFSDSSTVTVRFDSLGRRASMTDAIGTVRYEYDGAGNVAAVRRDGALAVCYTYDTQGRVKTLKVGDFYNMEYAYDFLGRLSSMKTPAGIVEYEYLTGQGQVVRTLPNGVKTFWKRQPNGELEEITHGFFAQPDSNKYTVLAQYIYAHGPDGRITAIRERSTRGDFMRRYAYDVMGRLTAAGGPGNQEYRYEYDAVGNRTRATCTGCPEQVCTYDWAGRLTTMDGKPVQYDAGGNLVEAVFAGTIHQYRYYSDGHLAEAKAGSESVHYEYDGSGCLIVRKGATGQMHFIPDPFSLHWQPLVIEEPDRVQTLVIWDDVTPLALMHNGKIEWLLHDHLGTVRLVTDARGDVVRSCEYDPYGLPGLSESPISTIPRFAGLFWDRDAKVYLAMARGYSPDLRAFLQPDPEGRSGRLHPGSSLWSFCYDDPVNFTDRSGAFPEWCDRAWTWSNAFYRSLLSFEGTREQIDYWENAPFRDDVVKATIETLLQTDSYDVMEAAGRAQVYRKSPDTFTKHFPDASMPTAQEWQAIDDFLFAWSVHTEGSRSLDLSRPFYTLNVLQERFVASGVHNGGIVAWLGAHQVGELVPGLMQRVSQKSFDWMLLGDLYGQQKVSPRSVRLPSSEVLHGDGRPRTSPFLQGLKQSIGGVMGQIDEFLCPPAYGDEVFAAGHSSYVVSGLSGGILASTTGPGKRGGRGGGITRPPSWNPPGPQGTPPGPQPKPGGKPPRGGGKSSNFSSSLMPSRVGGVYLGGAGGALADVGRLDAATLDQNNNLVLIGKTGDQIKLPPLRLDDVVTVFRSVYLYGEGPTVTIDPDPRDPKGLPMLIVHSKATEATYVGWVLYQADRLMKGYTLGVDNITGLDVQSHVAEYPKVLDMIYFGGEDPGKLQTEGHWERFWIVPAEVRRLAAPRNELTLFDVPLKVNTQTMKWQDGALVDDCTGKSSPGALAFTKWFTANYDLIAEERFLTPPPESGIRDPVPVFTELRRIALITAIAEKLRDQGVLMPFWMRDYQVRPVPFDTNTPGCETRRSNGRIMTRVFGGVNLSAGDRNVKLFTKDSDVSSLPPAVQSRFGKELDAAGFLEEGVRESAPRVEPLQSWILAHQTGTYQAVAMPGAETQAAAPCRLTETDLAVSVDGGRSIELVRRYNSFFDPVGPWGQGWALDLPRLDEVKVPVRRDAKQVEYQAAYELVTPLNREYVRLSRIAQVPELNGSILQVPDKACEFFGLANAKPDFLSGPTHELIRKDGGVWHFSKTGELVATEQGGLRTVYERDTNGRLTRIVGLLGGRLVGSIDLNYNAQGRLARATARKSEHESTIRYEYDNAGRLSKAASSTGTLGYRYDRSWVKAVTFRMGAGTDQATEEAVVRRFEYNNHGQLVAEFDATGARTEYRVTADSRGNEVTVISPGASSPTYVVRYDLEFRPVEAMSADGTRAAWTYSENGDTVSERTTSDGRKTRWAESADHRRRTMEPGDGRKIIGDYDPAGRLTSLTENGRLLLRQEWSGDGRLLTAGDEACAEHVEYGEDGLVSRVLLAPPEERGQFAHWQEIKLDAAGQPHEITDFRGLHVLVDYDDAGELAALACRREGKDYGFRITRDSSGRVQEMESSWGRQGYTYDAAGALEQVRVEKGGRTVVMQYRSGLLQSRTQFDGGEVRVGYCDEPSRRGFPREIRMPNDLLLTYGYDQENRLSRVDVGRIYRMEFAYDAQGRLSSLTQSPLGQ